MSEITLQNVDRIVDDIKREEITFSHLLDDLIDHICCDVEYEMESGLSFSDAYRKVRKKMGSHRIREIQEETLYAVDTKYRQMKNTMKISGIAGSVLLGFSAVFKIQHWPGAGAMLTFGAFLLAFIFMPSALGVLWKETHSRKRIFLYVSAFFAGFFFISGTLWKVQHWPGSSVILTLAALFGVLFFIPAVLADKLKDTEKKSRRPVYIVGTAGVILYLAGMLCKIMHWPLATLLMVTGLIVLCTLAFPWFTWLTWKEDSSVSPRFIFIVITMLIIIVPGALVSLNIQKSYENGFFPHVERQQMIYNVKSDQNDLLMSEYRDSSVYQKMEQVHFRTGELVSYITDIQVRMVQESEEKAGSPVLAKDQINETENGPVIIYSRLSVPFTPEPAGKFLLTGSEQRQNLESEIIKYANFISALQSGDDQNYSALAEASGHLVELLPEKTDMSLLPALHSLDLMKNTLLYIETILFNIIISDH